MQTLVVDRQPCDVKDASWSVRLYWFPRQLQADVKRSARLSGANRKCDELFVAPSLRIKGGERGRPVPSVFVGGGRNFAQGEVVTTFDGRVGNKGSRAAMASDHTIDAYGRPGKVIIGATSRQRTLAGVGAASIINDTSFDLVESLRRSRSLGRTTIVRREDPADCPNVEFVALVLESEYERVQDGRSDQMPSTVIAAVALRPLTEGDEVSVDYGDSYWRSFIEHQLELECERCA